MATRMQQRKGTAAQWTAADPILNAGEIGWESDTNKFKIGDGTNHWEDLTYFLDSTDTGFNAADYVQVTEKNEVNGVAILDANVNVITATGVVFEGATADAYETTLSVVDPTADRTIGIPNVDGTMITTGNLSSITTLGTLTQPITIEGTNSPLVFEGATANDFETTLAVTDPTADRTITLPDVTGTVITTGNLSGITSLGTISSIVFEGSTSDDFELTLAGGDPTADRTVSFPDAGGIVVVDTAEQTLTNKTLTSPLISNLSITDGSIVLEGSSPDNFETTLTVTDPTADRTISFPDVSGTVVTTGDTGSVTSTMIADGTIVDGDINASAAIGWDKLAISSTVSSTEIGYVDGVTSAIQTQLDAKATPSDISTHNSDTTSVHGIADTSKIVMMDAASTTLDGDLVVDGDFTVNGTNFSASATTITIEDNMVQLAHANSGNSVDLGLVVAYNDGAAKHSGIVRDVSTDKWKLFKGVTTEPTTTVDFTQGSLDDLQVNNITAAGVVFTDGTQTKEGVPSRTPIIQKTESYTLSGLSERDSLIEVASSSGTTITIPTNSAVAYPVGTSLDILQTSTGQVTIAGDTGVTVNATPGLKLRTQWSSATLFKRAENTWVVYGDLTA